MQWGGFPGGQVPPHFNRRTHRDTLRRQAARNSAIARVGPEGMLARGQVSEREAVDVVRERQEREEEREAVESARARVWRGELGESRQQQREAIVLAKEVDDPLDLDADPGWELLREARQRRAAQRASVAQESTEALAQGGAGRTEAQREARQRILAARLLERADEEAADIWRAEQAEDVEVVESDEDGSVTEGVTDSDSDGTSVSLFLASYFFQRALAAQNLELADRIVEVVAARSDYIRYSQRVLTARILEAQREARQRVLAARILELADGSDSDGTLLIM